MSDNSARFSEHIETSQELGFRSHELQISFLDKARVLAQRDTSTIALFYDDAEDFVSEFLALIWRAIVFDVAPSLAEPRRHKAWLRTCLHRHRIAFMAARRRIERSESQWLAFDELHEADLREPVSHVHTPEEALLQRECDIILHDMIARLRPLPQQLIIDHYFKGQSLEELATGSGRSSHAVAQSLYDARSRLRSWLEQEDWHLD